MASHRWRLAWGRSLKAQHPHRRLAWAGKNTLMKHYLCAKPRQSTSNALCEDSLCLWSCGRMIITRPTEDLNVVKPSCLPGSNIKSRIADAALHVRTVRWCLNDSGWSRIHRPQMAEKRRTRAIQRRRSLLNQLMAIGISESWNEGTSFKRLWLGMTHVWSGGKGLLCGWNRNYLGLRRVVGSGWKDILW